MKLPCIPHNIDNQYINDCISECVLFMQSEGPWWLRRSCLNTLESRRLISLYMLCVELWHKRETQADAHKRAIPPNEHFNLYPLIQHFSYTLTKLSQTPEEFISSNLIGETQKSCDMIQTFLKQWHDIDANQAINHPLTNIT